MPAVRLLEHLTVSTRLAPAPHCPGWQWDTGKRYVRLACDTGKTLVLWGFWAGKEAIAGWWRGEMGPAVTFTTGSSPLYSAAQPDMEAFDSALTKLPVQR